MTQAIAGLIIVAALGGAAAWLVVFVAGQVTKRRAAEREAQRLRDAQASVINVQDRRRGDT